MREAAEPRELLMSGVLQGKKTADVVAPFEGAVKELKTDVGSEVAAGDALLVLDTTKVKAQLLDARAAHVKVEAALREVAGWRQSPAYGAATRQVRSDQRALKDAERRFEDTNRLHQLGVVSRDELEQAAQTVESARAQMLGSGESLQQLEPKASTLQIAEHEVAVSLARSRAIEAALVKNVIHSPISGVVTTLGGEFSSGAGSGLLGSRVPEGGLLVRIVDRSHLQVVGSVSESAVGKIQVGQSVHVMPVNQPGQVHAGKVSRVAALPIQNGMSDMVDERRTARFQVAIDLLTDEVAKGDLPKLGTNAEARIILSERPQGVLVDLAAVVTSGQTPGTGKLTMRRAGGAARELVVKLGVTAQDGVHVIHPELTLGDEVLLPAEAVPAPKAGSNAENSAVPDPTPAEGAGVRAWLMHLFGMDASAPL